MSTPNLQVIDPAGNITDVSLASARSQVDAAPGYSYQIRGDGVQPAPRLLRIDGDLVIEGLPGGQELVLAGFFSACTPEQVCTAAISNFEGANNVAITPATQPLAALAEGSFLMFSPASQSAEIPPPPEAERPLNWKPIAALGGGLLVAAAGLSGGSSGGDESAPAAPSIDNPVTNSSRPTFTGSAEPGSNVAMTIAIGENGQRVTYNTTADADGRWSINTASATPTAGSLPEAGLPADGSATINAVATDPAGNVSPTTVTQVVLDVTPPDAPTLQTTGELSGPGASLVLNKAETADGTVLSGSAEADSEVTVRLNNANGFSLIEAVRADASGNWSLSLDAGELPASDGTVSITLSAVDAAGNIGAAATTEVTIDRSLSGAQGVITRIKDDASDTTLSIGNNGITNDTTPAIQGTLSNELATDESLLVLRDGVAIGTATVAGTRFSLTDNITRNGTLEYQVQVVDSAGNQATPSDTFSVTLDTVAPDQLLSFEQFVAVDGTREVPLTSGEDTTGNQFVVTIGLSDVLESDESVQLFRVTGANRALVGSADAQEAGDGLSLAFADSAPNDGTYLYEAQIVDAANNIGASTAAFTVTVLPETASDPNLI